mmetsp:Transcript_30328/g.51900  ORF Transcript_30328/g.51900 Transcript_30328/m.51900 type:complete len:885 (+) Transcript_30328:289-2943(+)
MQNLISNWTKINQDHFEYFEKDEASAAGGGGGSVHSVRSNLSHALNAAGIDPRSPEMEPSGMGPSPPPPSGSSLSNVSFSKGTITAPSRQPTPDTASSTSFASRQTRGVMSSSHNGFTQQHLELYQQQQQQQHQQLTQAMMMQHQQNGSRRRAHQSNHVHGGHNSSNHNHINPLPPPQAGADAILGRRKPAGIGQSSSHQHYNFDMASAMGLQQIHQGEPPPSLSTSSEQQDTKRAAAAASGGLQRTQSSSLWHSQKSTQSNQSGHSSRSSSNSVTASLDKMDAAAQAAMAELNSVNSSLNQGLANFSVSNRSAQRSSVPNPITNISSNASAATNNSSRNILKFNRQKLRKSHSRSDLVREMALDRRHNNPSEQVHQFSESNPLQQRVSEKSSTSGTGSSNATPISSLNMSVGKSANFPTSLETSSNNSARQSTLRNGRSAEAPSFNSHTMMQDWNQSLTMRRQSQASAGVSSGGSTPVISNHNNLTGDRRVSNLSQGGNLDAINEQKPVDIGVVNIPSSQLQRQQQQQQQQMDPGSGCDRCVQMESAILSLQADIEYVRTLELQKEFVCRECESGPPPPAQSVSSAVSLGSRGSRSSRLPRRKSAAGDKSSIGGRLSRTVVFLRDASKRLADLSTRHKKEVKQSHYERAYWQNDMHLKLEKFAMMCKNLNEDAAQRSNEVKELTSKLEKVTSERNGLVSQVETLKARVGLYEGESVVQSRLRDNFEKGEAGALDLFDKAMKGRDETIEDLSNRLAAALEEVERSRISGNSMRRHIIFPPSRSMSHNSDPFGDAGSAPPSPKIRRSMCSEEEGEHDDSAKLSEKAKLSLEASMVQSSEREKALQSQLDVLEQELEQARAILQDTDDHYLEAQLSMKHTSSNSSL